MKRDQDGEVSPDDSRFLMFHDVYLTNHCIPYLPDPVFLVDMQWKSTRDGNRTIFILRKSRI